MEVCADHTEVACAGRDCAEKVMGARRFCDAHECEYPTCDDAKKTGGDDGPMPFCASRRCLLTLPLWTAPPPSTTQTDLLADPGSQTPASSPTAGS